MRLKLKTSAVAAEVALASWLVLLCATVHSQTYSIDWYKIAGGGGASTNTLYSVTGTIGQPDADGAMTGGGYSVTGGFWSLTGVVQTPGAPLLMIANVENEIIVWWSPSATGFALQTNSDLSTTNWVNYTGPIVNNSVTNSLSAGKHFYRLKQ